ncbi:hypothetical protein T265_01994 [Opisthorchis viverrini]|uniref:Uncharacterized protein n=1 Tax=Opisthorchis viverrini TaxID=6198 RepID=A0A074ZXU4_OPIVI|nr:hypothetical protein T265_01994 [Opisthorchis viverrini]KER31911.1 hypothetical protein T265_01994 [Opisthorchis viverrini]
MESFKQRLVAIRNEENELRDKLTEVEEEIRSLKQSNDQVNGSGPRLSNILLQLNGVIHGLQSNEKLLVLKLESGTARLRDMETKIAAHRLRHSTSEQGVKVLNAAEMNPESKEEDIESELNQKREEIRLLGSQYDEVVIHQQHLQTDVVKKEQKAKTLEKCVFYLFIMNLAFRAVNELETQYSGLMKACDKAQVIEPHEEAIDDLETRLRDLQRQLETATDAYETSEREITRLDRLISKNKADLQKQQSANESLKKELDGIFAELGSAD